MIMVSSKWSFLHGKIMRLVVVVVSGVVAAQDALVEQHKQHLSPAVDHLRVALTVTFQPYTMCDVSWVGFVRKPSPHAAARKPTNQALGHVMTPSHDTHVHTYTP